MPAYTSVTSELAAQYPALKGMVGKTVTHEFLESAKAKGSSAPADQNITLTPPKKTTAPRTAAKKVSAPRAAAKKSVAKKSK